MILFLEVQPTENLVTGCFLVSLIIHCQILCRRSWGCRECGTQAKNDFCVGKTDKIGLSWLNLDKDKAKPGKSDQIWAK